MFNQYNKTMKILDVTLNLFRNEVISKNYLFEDDKSITVSLSGDVEDMDGFMVAPESRLKTIEDKFNIKINR